MLNDASWGGSRGFPVPGNREREPGTSQFYRGVHGGRPSDVPDVPIRDGDVVVDTSDEVDVFVTDIRGSAERRRRAMDRSGVPRPRLWARRVCLRDASSASQIHERTIW